jgi:hypothetical protein
VLLVAKEHLEFRNILECTGGIVFLGCIHRENHPKFEELCLKCAAVEFGIMSKHDTVESLRKAGDWEAVKEIMESFRSLNSPFEVRGFFELRPTTYHVGRLSVIRKSECVSGTKLSSPFTLIITALSRASFVSWMGYGKAGRRQSES